MSSAINDDELSISLPRYEHNRSRPSLPPVVSPPARLSLNTPLSESPGTARAMNRLHQYTFVRNIGEGSFGKVKLARHKITGQEVAMKTISRRKLISRDMAGRIEREIQYLQLLRHPHIIKLYTVITTKSDIYMVLEYVPMELFEYIVKHGRLNEAKARKLFQQIICAVEYCHRHKIVHRDLKPENLLLDNMGNVKIADFGLSNIMTDGNFLKTSCGSPNYAAPEVIGGKLYAGPEVDVWSCGVILYVFLVGRLPFDDEFIPALFKKIQAGTFHIPAQTPAGAVNLIKRCLQVHPVHRISIPEIRQDEWFMKDLPAYLVDPVEEFLDTGIDPAKAIDPRQLAPGKPPEVVEKIHESVVGKLGRTMGYAKDDVKDALSKDEPSAIKDAYLIVRENQLMIDTPQYRTQNNPELESFMASSPPGEPNYPNFPGSPLTKLRATEELRPLTPSRGEAHRASRTLSDTPSVVREEQRERVSNIRVLNTSLPHVHDELIQIREKAKTNGEDPDLVLHPSQMKEHPTQDVANPIPEEAKDERGVPVLRSKEEQEATSRALKPHSRSVTAMNQMAGQKVRPHGMTTMQTEERRLPSSKKPKKWQFGIRSRNAPYEAMKCLFSALRAQNADWEVIPSLASDGQDGEDEKENLPPPPPELAPGERHHILQSKYPNVPSDYYIPRDPWNIRARILKKGMLMPGDAPSLSANSSAVSLPTEAQNQLKKHIEKLGGYTSEEVAKALGVNSGTNGPKLRSPTASTHSTRPNSSFGDQSAPAPAPGSSQGHDAFTGPASQPLSRPDSLSGLNKMPSESIGVWVFIDIQLYMLESNTYVVDFKCDGYQNVIWHDPRKERERNKSPNSTTGSVVTSPTTSRPTSGFGQTRSHSPSRGEDDGEGENMEPYWKPVSKRYRNLEKEISSPYPYLDVASDLVAQLASAAQ